MEEPEALASVAAALTRSAGRGSVAGLQRLEGGRNNRVYRVDIDAGEPLILKLYHSDPRDTRDRLKHEWSFLSYSWARDVRTIPEPLAHDPRHNAGLYSFVAGRKLAVGEVGKAHLDAALRFVLQVNAQPRQLDGLPTGSEACFSLAEHLATIEGRVVRLATLDPQAPLRMAAEALVRERLRPAWAAAKAALVQGAIRLGIPLDAPIEREAVCLSPSDFGFHNALVDGEAISFLDFEYAGRDDPAKLACDFFCQPQIPPPAALHRQFIQALVRGLGLASWHEQRCNLLLDAYRVKWACIMLNDFSAVGSARRAFADGNRTAGHFQGQLDRAERALVQIATPA